MLKTYKQILEEIKAFITPERYVKGNYGLDPEGNGVFGYNPAACQFCFLGAAQRIIGNTAWEFEKWAGSHVDNKFGLCTTQKSDRGYEHFVELTDYLLTLPDASVRDIECVE